MITLGVPKAQSVVLLQSIAINHGYLSFNSSVSYIQSDMTDAYRMNNRMLLQVWVVGWLVCGTLSYEVHMCQVHKQVFIIIL